MGAVITSEATRVKVIYNDANDIVFERYFYRDAIAFIDRMLNSQRVEIIRVHLSNGEYIDAHFSNIDTIQTLADATPISISDNATLLAKLLEIKDE